MAIDKGMWRGKYRWGGVRRLAASDVRGSEGGVSEGAWEEG